MTPRSNQRSMSSAIAALKAAAPVARRCTRAGYQRVNQIAATNATTEAPISTESGIAGTNSAAASAATCTAKLTPHTPETTRLTAMKSGRSPKAPAPARARTEA